MKNYWDKRREARPDLELLPPNTKFECPKCYKKFRKLWKCKDGIKRCKMCKKKQITNKFYIPITERKNLSGTIGKFSMNSTEKNQLHRQFMNEGLDSTQAWKKVYAHVKILDHEKEKKGWSDKERRRYFAMRSRERKQETIAANSTGTKKLAINL